MNLNFIVFPKPEFEFRLINNYLDELIFIPRNVLNQPKNISKYIPCLFLKDKSNKISKNFIIMFHGNAEDIFAARKMGDTLRQKMCMNVIIVEYPGYSIYEGEPSAELIQEDTLIVYEFIKNYFELEDRNIFVFGRSIGTSPAIYLASIKKPNVLVTVSAFTSIQAVAKDMVGFLNILLKNRFNSIDYIKNVTCPTLLIHGQCDPLINFKETLLLKEKCDCPFEVFLPEDMTHNEFDLDEDIATPMSRFLKRNCIIDNTENKFKENKDKIDLLYKRPDEVDQYIRKNTH